jgi:hypothetical protein
MTQTTLRPLHGAHQADPATAAASPPGEPASPAQVLVQGASARARQSQAQWRARSALARADLRSEVRCAPVQALLQDAASGAAGAALAGWMLRTRA